MLESKIRIVSEALARAINRRQFLKRTGSTIAASLATLALGSVLTDNQRKALAGSKLVPSITCSPPGPYCNTGAGNLSGCHGAHCWQHLYNSQVIQCRVYYQYYPGGCWTSADGWTCCDCSCGTPQVTTCGCAQQHTAPAAQPM